MAGTVLFEKRSRIAYVTLNRPESLNALNPEMLAELDAVWQDYAEDEEMLVAIVTGAGERAFCSGYDLRHRVTHRGEAELRQPQPWRPHPLDTCWKPVIAAVHGYAVGGGLELALRCDVIVADETAQFGLPEARRGLFADDGGVVRLPRRLPYHIAMGMLLTGQLIGAAEAHRYGLVNEVSAPGAHVATAERWAAEMLECAPLSLQAAKQIVLSTLGLPEPQALGQVERLEAVRRLRLSSDYLEGPRAFIEKRRPQWSGD